MLIRATTQKNFESAVLNGKRPSARHTPCKAPAEVPRPRARQSREVSERLPRRRGTEWVGAGFFPGSRKCYGTGQWGGVRTFATYSRKRRIAHSGTANFKVCELYLDKAHVKETGRGRGTSGAVGAAGPGAPSVAISGSALFPLFTERRSPAPLTAGARGPCWDRALCPSKREAAVRLASVNEVEVTCAAFFGSFGSSRGIGLSLSPLR